MISLVVSTCMIRGLAARLSVFSFCCSGLLDRTAAAVACSAADSATYTIIMHVDMAPNCWQHASRRDQEEILQWIYSSANTENTSTDVDLTTNGALLSSMLLVVLARPCKAATTSKRQPAAPPRHPQTTSGRFWHSSRMILSPGQHSSSVCA